MINGYGGWLMFFFFWGGKFRLPNFWEGFFNMLMKQMHGGNGI